MKLNENCDMECFSDANFFDNHHKDRSDMV